MRMFDIPCFPNEVEDLMKAWSDYWGEVPAMTIVDDIEKLKGVKDYQSFGEMIVTLGNAAKSMNTVVFGIHHINRSGGSAAQRPKLRTMTYGGDYDASYVLGLWRPAAQTLRVSVLKNRTGEDDPNGTYYAELHVEATRAVIREKTWYEIYGGKEDEDSERDSTTVEVGTKGEENQ